MKKLIVILLSFLLFIQLNIHVLADNENELNIMSEAVILVDSQSGVVLYEKNADKKMYPASLTKIATAIYAIEMADLEEKVTVTEDAVKVDGTRVYLNAGEEVTLKRLVQGMLINSGNDAALAIAYHLHGSIESFSTHLNKYLEEQIGVHQTHFTNPHGLFGEEHYTTAHDLAIITNYALRNPVFKEIYGTRELAWDGESWDTTIYTHHRLLKGEIPFEGVTGGKTGFVDEAKQTLATSAENDQIQLTAIALKADYKRDIYNDTTSLLNYGFTHYKTSSLGKNTEYSLGNDRYILAQDTFVTIPLSGSQMDVTEEGELLIQTENNKKVQAIPLMQVKDEPVIKQEKTVTVQEKTEIKATNFNAFYIVIPLILLGMFITIKRKYFVR